MAVAVNNNNDDLAKRLEVAQQAYANGEKLNTLVADLKANFVLEQLSDEQIGALIADPSNPKDVGPLWAPYKGAPPTRR